MGKITSKECKQFLADYFKEHPEIILDKFLARCTPTEHRSRKQAIEQALTDIRKDIVKPSHWTRDSIKRPLTHHEIDWVKEGIDPNDVSWVRVFLGYPVYEMKDGTLRMGTCLKD